jgi:hypothetical protein
MAFYSLLMGEISTVGWIEVPRDHLSDLMSGKRFPVPERCPDNQPEYTEFQYGVVEVKNVVDTMDEENWKREWLE